MYPQFAMAIAFGATAHRNQVRKYDNLPYITHPVEVALLLHSNLKSVSDSMLAAAVLHDVIEDTENTAEDLEQLFDNEVVSLVVELTDQFTDPAIGNRQMRKSMERGRLAKISVAAQTIKYADLISNTQPIVARDPGFARVYLEEKAWLLEVMNMGSPIMYKLAMEALAEGQAQLVQHRLKAAM